MRTFFSFIWNAVIFTVAIFLLSYANPSEGKMLRETRAQLIDASADGSMNIFKTFDVALKATTMQLKYKNYFVFSLAYHDDNLISIGGLGIVYVIRDK